MGAIDDAVQGAARRVIYGQKDEEQTAGSGQRKGVRGVIGMPFAARAGSKQKSEYRFDDTNEGKAAMIAARALQAGTITAAGLGLHNLTQAFSGQTAGTLMPE